MMHTLNITLNKYSALLCKIKITFFFISIDPDHSYSSISYSSLILRVFSFVFKVNYAKPMFAKY